MEGAERRGSRGTFVLGVAEEPGAARLGALGRDPRMRWRSPGAVDDLLGRARCVWIDGEAPGAREAARRALDAGRPTVLSSAPPEALAELVAHAAAPLVVGGPGVGALSVAQLAGAIRGEAHGALERLAIRLPGGRRVHPAASKRTAFGPDQRADWTLDEAQRTRLRTLASPYWRVAEELMPGAAARLGLSELIADAGRERLVAHARVGGVPLVVELDRECRGDEDWEIEATFARATLLARFRGDRGVLITRAPLRKTESRVDAQPPDELLVRHLAARPTAPAMGTARTAIAATEAVDAALAGAPARAAERPLSVVLVHVPRYRNRYDELMLPSLAVARLRAYLRGHGFEVPVADLEAWHADLPLEAFTDDARVEAWLAGGADAEIEARLEAMWPTLQAALHARCLVGFSIVDYFGHFQMNLASCLARLVKERTGQPTVLGGERDQVDGDRALGPQRFFDYVVDGDGETALHELACLEAYRDRDARFVDAVWTRAGDSVVRNRIVRSHLNAMPRPDFDGVPLERYRRRPTRALLEALAADGLAPAEPPAPFLYLPYGFVKGCVADCTFCSAKEHLDVQAPEKTVDELLALSERHEVRDFVFLNNLVNLSPKWLRKFCRRLIDARADLQWTDSCRPTGIDDELAAMMRDSGCLLLNFGAESGSDAVLGRMQKGLTRADIVSSLRATHRAGIVNRVNLIAGYFHETDADVDRTISLVEELHEAIDVIGCFQGFYLFPGMGVDPEVEGIVLHDGLDRLETGQVTMAYDEIGGLRWEDKRAAIDASRNRILARIEELSIRTVDKIDEYDLFWISRAYRDKAITAEYVLRAPPPEASRVNQAALLPGGVTGRVDAG